MTTLDAVRAILGEQLQLGTRASTLDRATRLIGGLPELDSMAVLAVLAALEERFGIAVDDDDISAETFATVGSLCDYVETKIAA